MFLLNIMCDLICDGIHSLLRQADVRGRADVIYSIWRISLCCGSGL